MGGARKAHRHISTPSHTHGPKNLEEPRNRGVNMKRNSESAAVEPKKTKCQFKFLWGPEPCKVFYVENDECPCPTSKYRSYFTRKATSWRPTGRSCRESRRGMDSSSRSPASTES